MPVNAPIEYYKAEEKFNSAKTKEEKIACLEEMIRLLPKHKGTHNVLAQLRKKMAKLKSEKRRKTGSRSSFVIKKEGAEQVCLLGLTNSGKSTLLKALTGKDVEIADYPYTTKKPQFGMMKYEDVWIQIVEIPSTFNPGAMGIVYGTDLIVVILDGEKNLDEQKREIEDILDKRRIKIKRLYVVTKKPIGLDKLKKKIWKSLGVIRVYTKTPGKNPEKKPIIMEKESTVGDVAKEVHKSFLEHFRFARVFGHSVKFNGARVGLDHVLIDKDVVEIRA